MTRIERLNNLKAAREIMLAEYAEIEKQLGIATETIPVYAGGSRYSLAGPGDDEIIGYRKITTYKNPRYLERRNYLSNELEKNREKIRRIEEKL